MSVDTNAPHSSRKSRKTRASDPAQLGLFDETHAPSRPEPRQPSADVAPVRSVVEASTVTSSYASARATPGLTQAKEVNDAVAGLQKPAKIAKPSRNGGTLDGQLPQDEKSQKKTSRLIDRNQMLTTEEAAALLGLKAATLSNWREDGSSDLPFSKFGRSVRYRYSDVVAFAEKTQCTSTLAAKKVR